MNQPKLTILQINDTHGYLEPHPELFWQGDKAEYRPSGGYARLLTILKRVRQERDGAVIALDNGDTLHGTFHAVESRGEALIVPVNRLGLEAWTVHWDFAYQQMGGYVKRCLGLTLYVKFENPAGSRIQQCFIGDQELKRKEWYKAAFVTTQGVPKKYGCQRLDLELHAIDALKQYCAAHPRVNADLRGTVVPV